MDSRPGRRYVGAIDSAATSYGAVRGSGLRPEQVVQIRRVGQKSSSPIYERLFDRLKLLSVIRIGERWRYPVIASRRIR
jgi:hypothetical protein